jgi:hypothetical protein
MGYLISLPSKRRFLLFGGALVRRNQWALWQDGLIDTFYRKRSCNTLSRIVLFAPPYPFVWSIVSDSVLMQVSFINGNPTALISLQLESSLHDCSEIFDVAGKTSTTSSGRYDARFLFNGAWRRVRIAVSYRVLFSETSISRYVCTSVSIHKIGLYSFHR